MSASIDTDSTIASLRHDLAALGHDVSNLVDHLRAGAVSETQSPAGQVGGGAQHSFRDVAADGMRAARAVGKKIEEQPVAALLVAMGIGYIGGRLLPR